MIILNLYTSQSTDAYGLSCFITDWKSKK